MTLLPPPAYMIFSAFVSRRPFLPAVLPKTSDQHTTAKLFPQRLQLRVQATASVCVPGLRGQSTSQLELWPQHWQDLGVLVTKPRLIPQHPSLLSPSGSGSADVTVRPECHYSRISTGPSTSTLKWPNHPKTGSKILAGENLHIVH